MRLNVLPCGCEPVGLQAAPIRSVVLQGLAQHSRSVCVTQLLSVRLRPFTRPGSTWPSLFAQTAGVTVETRKRPQ